MNGVVEKAHLKLKESTVYVLEGHCKTGLFIMSFHGSHHLFHDLDTFGSQRFLDSSGNEHFNVFIRRVHWITSMKRVNRTRVPF